MAFSQFTTSQSSDPAPRIPPYSHALRRPRRTPNIRPPPPSCTCHRGGGLCQVQGHNPRRTRRRSRLCLSLAVCVTGRPKPATCPCSQGANSSTRRAQHDWSVGDPRCHTRRRRPNKKHSHPPTFLGRCNFHGQPARRQSRGGKGRRHCLVNVPLFCQTMY